MINASELRIGNWIKDEETGKYYQVEQLRLRVGSELWVVYSIEKNTVYSKQVQPIPLTPEILEKCRFKNIGDVYWISISNLKCELQFEIYATDYVNVLRGNFCDLILDKIKHLHQLQNLYFCLTGEELIFNNSIT